MNNKKFWISLLAGLMAVVMLLGLIVSLLPQKASAAQSSSEIKEQIKELEDQYDKQQAQIDELASKQSGNLSDIKTIIADKALIEEQVGLLYTQIQVKNDEIAAYNVMIADMQEELEEAEQRLADLNEKNKERIRAMEEDGALSYWSVLFEANSFSELLDRLNMVQEIAASDSRRLEELRVAAQEVSTQQEAMIAEREALNAAKKELDEKQSEMLLKSAEAQELLNELAARADEYDVLMDEMEEELEDLVASLGKAEEELDAALYAEYLATLTTAPPPTTTAATSGSSGNYYTGAQYGGESTVDESGITWVVPCTYSKVSSAFGWRIHPVYGDWRFHSGVDLSCSCKMKSDGTTDSPIYASRAGVVTVSKYNSSGGWYVTIDHLDGYKSSYLHMCSKPFVNVGDVVAAGQVIGCIGSTGVSTGDHLHFSVYKDGTAVNPMDYIG